MPRRSFKRHIAYLSAGIVLLAVNGLCVAQEQPHQEAATNKTSNPVSSSDTDHRLPAASISTAKENAADRSKNESCNNECQNLNAQLRAARAGERQATAAEWQIGLTIAQIILVLLGTFAVFSTLGANRRSAQAAEDAISLARDQSTESSIYTQETLKATRLTAEAAVKANERERPWMLYLRVFHSAGGGPVTSQAHVNGNVIDIPDCFVFNMVYTNYSPVPAVRVKIYIDFQLVDFNQQEPDISFLQVDDNPAFQGVNFVVGPGMPINSAVQTVIGYGSMIDRRQKILLYTSVEYGHPQFAGSIYRTVMCGYLYCHRDIEVDGVRGRDFTFQPVGGQNTVI